LVGLWEGDINTYLYNETVPETQQIKVDLKEDCSGIISVGYGNDLEGTWVYDGSTLVITDSGNVQYELNVNIIGNSLSLSRTINNEEYFMIGTKYNKMD
jgi:hypothetical protein